MANRGETIKQRFGRWGEQVAARFLTRKGYDIIAKNVRYRVGEIDIIAWHDKQQFGRTLCFIEVKTRSKSIESGIWVTAQRRKMRAMQRAARLFCLQQRIDIDQTPIQFEYVAVKPIPRRQSATILHKVIRMREY